MWKVEKVQNQCFKRIRLSQSFAVCHLFYKWSFLSYVILGGIQYAVWEDPDVQFYARSRHWSPSEQQFPRHAQFPTGWGEAGQLDMPAAVDEEPRQIIGNSVYVTSILHM